MLNFIYGDKPIYFIRSDGSGLEPEVAATLFAEGRVEAMYLHQNGDITYTLVVAGIKSIYRMVSLAYELPIEEGTGTILTSNCVASGQLMLTTELSSAVVDGTITVTDPTKAARFIGEGIMEHIKWIIAAEYRPECGWREADEILLANQEERSKWIMAIS